MFLTAQTSPLQVEGSCARAEQRSPNRGNAPVSAHYFPNFWRSACLISISVLLVWCWDYSRETPSSQGRGNPGAASQTLPHLSFQALPGMGFRHLLHISLPTWWDSFCPKPTFSPALLPLLPSWDSCGCILHCCSWAWELIRLCFIWWECTATNPHHGLMQNNTCERGTHGYPLLSGLQRKPNAPD